MNPTENREIWRAIKELKTRTGKPNVRVSSGGGGGSGASRNTPTVETLPAIPTTPETEKRVFWTSAGAGTGDDQVWHAYTGQSRWYPTTFTDKDGTPGA